MSFEEVVESKLEMIAELSKHATSVLADPVWELRPEHRHRALPGDVGVISGIEDLYYSPATSPVGFDTELRLKEGWDPAKLSALGADAAKLVVFHREDGAAADIAHQHEVVAQVARECHAVGLPLIVEPLWFPVAGEDLEDPAVREAGAAASQLGGQLPRGRGGHHEGGVPRPRPHRPRRVPPACADLDAAVDGPWVLLSAGVTFEGFRTQVDVAADHGCSGFMAGRAIWGDAVGRLAPQDRGSGAALAARRLDELPRCWRAGRPRVDAGPHGGGRPRWSASPGTARCRPATDVAGRRCTHGEGAGRTLVCWWCSRARPPWAPSSPAPGALALVDLDSVTTPLVEALRRGARGRGRPRRPAVRRPP